MSGTDNVSINGTSGNINCDQINVRENVVVNCAINHRNGRNGVGMIPYAGMQDIVQTGNGPSTPISTTTYSTLICMDDIGAFDTTHVLGSGKVKNQLKVIRSYGNEGSAEIIPNALAGGSSITLPGTTDSLQAYVTLLWRDGKWTVIDRSSPLVVITA